MPDDGTSVGGAYVEIHAKTDQLRQEVEDGLQEATAGKEPHIVAHLDLDEEDFSTGLDRADKDGKSFGSQKFTPRLDLDDGPLAAKFDENIARLNELTDKVWDVKINPKDAAAVAALDELKQKLVDLNGEAQNINETISDRGVDKVKADIDALEAKLDELSHRQATPGVKLGGDADALARLAAVTAKIDDLKAKVGDARVQVEGDVLAQGKLSALEAQLERLGKTTASAKVDLAGVADAEAKATALEAKLDTISSKGDAASKSLDNVGGSGGNASKGLDSAGASASNAGNSMGILATTALTLGPALVPIGAAAIAGLGGIATIAGQGAVGLGIFALAAKPVITSLNTAATAQQTYNNTVKATGASSTQSVAALRALTLSMQQLTPAESAAAGALGQFKSDYQAWAQSFDPTILPLLATGLGTAESAMSVFSPVVKDVGVALQGFATNVDQLVNGPFVKSFASLFAVQAGAAVTTFGHLLVGAGVAVAGLDRAFQPVITDIEGGLNRMAASMEHFGLTAGSNSGLQKFVAYIQQEGPQVLHVLETLGSDLLTLVQDAAQVGPGFISIIGGAASLLGDLERLNPQLTELALVALSAYKAFQVLGPAMSALKDVANIGQLLSGTAGADSAASGLGKAAAAAGEYGRALAGLSPLAVAASLDLSAFGDAAVSSVSGITAASTEIDAGFANIQRGALEAGATVELVSAEMAASVRGAALASVAASEEAVVAEEGIGIGLDAALGPIGLVAAGVGGLIALFHSSGDAAAHAAAQQQTWTQSFTQSAGSISDLKSEIAQLTSQNDALVASTTKTITTQSRFGDTTQTVSDATAAQSKTMHDNQGRLIDLNKALDDAQAKQAGLGAATQLTSGQLGNSATQAQVLAQNLLAAKTPAQQFALASGQISAALKTETGDVSNLTNVLNILVGTYLSAQGATLAQRQAVLSFSTALVAAHGDLTGTSAASLTAQQSANSFATSLYNTLIPALAKNGDTAAQITQITGGTVAAFDQAALHAGLTASQVAALNRTYDLTPKDIHTAIEQTGASGVIQAAQQAQQALQALANQTFTTHLDEVITVTGSAPSLHGGGGVLQHAAGTDFHPGGLAWVGEKGPELMQLPAGTKVASNAQSMGMVHSGLVKAPGYAVGIGAEDMGFQFGTQVNTGVDRALASDPHTVAIAGSSGSWLGTSGGFANNASWHPPASASVAPVTSLTGDLSKSLEKSLTTLADNIAKGLKGNLAQLTTYVDDAVKTVNQKLAGTGLQTVVDALGKNFTYLSTKAKESLSTITSQLSAAQAGVASIQQTIAQNASSLEGQFNITSVTGTSFTNPFNGSTWTAPVSGSNIISSLQADVKNLKTYRNLLDTLKGWGLSTELLQQLVAAGPAAGLAAAQALVAGGKKEVNLADVLQGQIDATSTQIATISATAVIGGKTVGLSQAEGIVTGLENSKAKVTAELDKLAKDMQQAINAALKIDGGKSGTFKTLGEQMIQGLQDGIKGASGPLKTELEQVVKSLEQTLGITPPAGGGGSGGSSAGWWGDSGTFAGNAWWHPGPKAKQKAVAFDSGSLPGGSGSGETAGTIVNIAPTVNVSGDVGPATVKLIRTELDSYTSHLQRELGRF